MSVHSLDENRLSCGHAFHVECIMEWFVRSDECPSCRASQDDDPIVIFKKKVLRTVEPDTEEDDDDGFGDFEDDDEREHVMYELWQMELRRNILDGVRGPRTDALKRALVFESTMEDLGVSIFGLNEDEVDSMLEFQDLHREPKNIIENCWFLMLEDAEEIYRALVLESTREDLTESFLMTQEIDEVRGECFALFEKCLTHSLLADARVPKSIASSCHGFRKQYDP